MEKKHRVVIVGGGFGGLNAAQELCCAPVEVLLVDRRNYHLFQPLLYQVATGSLSPANIAAPIRGILKHQCNAHVALGEVVDFDLQGKRVLLTDAELEYDTLVVAAGAVNFYFGRQEWAKIAPGLKNVDEATEMRRRILYAFERAERATDEETENRWLTFVIIGAGPTGVELAGALREVAQYTLAHDFRRIAAHRARVILVEGNDRVLRTFPPALSEATRRSLEEMGVEVRCNTAVTSIDVGGVTLKVGDTEEYLPAHTVLWSAGIKASPLGERLAEATGAELDRGGRLMVDETLNLPGHPDIFVIGDLAHAKNQAGEPLPGVAPVAIQEGRYVAWSIEQRLKGKPVTPFQYKDRGSMATIGRSRAVAVMGKLQFSGPLAWLSWLFVHLLFIVSFENRLLILFQWAWHYLTFSESARLITGDPVCPYHNANCPRKQRRKAGEQAPECAVCATPNPPE